LHRPRATTPSHNWQQQQQQQSPHPHPLPAATAITTTGLKRQLTNCTLQVHVHEYPPGHDTVLPRELPVLDVCNPDLRLHWVCAKRIQRVRTSTQRHRVRINYTSMHLHLTIFHSRNQDPLLPFSCGRSETPCVLYSSPVRHCTLARSSLSDSLCQRRGKYLG
jgi:hypothetical protein